MEPNPSTILIIEDDAFISQMLSALLKNANHHLVFASGGLEGLKSALALKPSLILLDIMLPEMDGFEVCRRMRQHPDLREIPIIMLTALDDRASRLAGLDAGADDFLTKPFDSLELQIRVKNLIRLDRYRCLLQEREKLGLAMQQVSAQNTQLKKLSQQILQVQEDEKHKLALELHDEVGQTLTGLKLMLEQTRETTHAIEPQLMDEMHHILSALLQTVRAMSLDLRPAVLDDFGLFAALDWLLKRFQQETGIIIHHNIDSLNEERFDRSIETAIFRIVQQALTNIARHAKVSEANVTLSVEPTRLQVIILDAGQGFDLQEHKPGESLGLTGMQERATLAGGQIFIHSTPGEGTLISVEFHLPEKQKR